MYRLKDYEDAKRNLESLEQSWENYSGNNPDKYRNRIRDARAMLDIIKSSLKLDGSITYSEKELLEKILDKEFPNAQSREIIEYQGKKYQRCFIRVSYGWKKNWAEIPT